MVLITHQTISRGGVLARHGKPKGYDVEPHVMSNAVVNPRIEVSPKKEKSMCRRSKGFKWDLSPERPRGNLFVLVAIHM